MKKALQVGNITALVITVGLNYFSNTRRIHQTTISEVSGKYENYFTPAGYAFSIWGLIYLLLVGFVIYQARGLNNEAKRNNTALAVGPWFIISCIANCCWLLVWLYEHTALSVLIMIILLISLLMIIFRLHLDLKQENVRRKFFVTLPFSIYAGWITVALIANTAAWLTGMDWHGLGLSETAWSIIMMAIAGIINLLVLFRRNLYFYVLTGIWGLIAVGMANKDNAGIVRTSLVVAAVLLLACIFRVFVNRKAFVNPAR
jgi:hypothetical protein